MKNKKIRLITMMVILVMVLAAFAGCTPQNNEQAERQANEVGETREHTEGSENTEGNGNEASEANAGSHSETAGHEEGAEGTEGGDGGSPILALDEGWDAVYEGLRFVMSYDAATNAVIGTVENVSQQATAAFHIEINLKQGNVGVLELANDFPVPALNPGEMVKVELLLSDDPLTATTTFDGYMIHPCGLAAEGSEATETGEEGSGAMLDMGAVYDVTQYGARLILSYDANTQKFTGTVENTTNAVLPRVRVEVHLDNGVELGPTGAVDLQAGGAMYVELDATGQNFLQWTTHCEVGNAEHGSAGETGDTSEGSESSEGGESGHDESGESSEGGHDESSEG